MHLGAAHLLVTHPVVLVPADQDAGTPGLGSQAHTAGRALPRAVVQRKTRLDQRRGHLDHQGDQLVLVGQRSGPVLGQPVELVTEVAQPLPLLLRLPAH